MIEQMSSCEIGSVALVALEVASFLAADILARPSALGLWAVGLHDRGFVPRVFAVLASAHGFPNR